MSLYWYQFDFTRRQRGRSPALVYVEAFNLLQAEVIFEKRFGALGDGERLSTDDGDPDYAGSSPLEYLARWLHDNEYKTPFEGTDVWLANELAKGAVFIPWEG